MAENRISIYKAQRATAREMLTLWGYKNIEEAPPTTAFFYNTIQSGNAVFWSLRDGDEIIGELYGFSELEDKDFADGKTTAYLCAFRVKKEYRGQGCGSILMETALSELKKMGFRHATIGVGMTEMDNQKMYHHMGFRNERKECFFDPCARDKDGKPMADEGFILLSKEL